MKQLSGKLVSPGYADGRAILFSDRWTTPAREPVEDVEKEVVRLHRALRAAHKELEGISARVHSEFGAEEAAIFSSHLEILDDPVVFDDIVARIRADRLSAGVAIQDSMTQFADRLASVDDPYLREREQDIRDVGRRILRHVSGHLRQRGAEFPPDTIIVAVELLPSDLVELDYEKVVGVVTERGGATSHLAILARSLGIPAITGIHDATALVQDGERLLINGDDATVIVAPNFTSLQGYRTKLRSYLDSSSAALRDQHLPCQTRDGQSVAILANMARPNDAEIVASQQLDGVGLLRTEFLFLDHPQPPDIGQQIELYEGTARRLGNRELVIRTLDLGGDKFPLFLERELENNPGMGVRGIRASLSVTRQLFVDQLRAILRVSRQYPVSILLPMVVGVDELREAQAIVREIAAAEGLPRSAPVGVLVETPAAVMMIDALAREADFISVGTNDLTQFLLAADRNALESVAYYPGIHPALLRAVKRVEEGAARWGKSVTLCGELASVPEFACLFVGMGIRRLSMSPASTPRVKQAIRQASYAQLKSAADAALAAGTVEEVVHGMREIFAA